MTPEQRARLEQWARTSTTGKHYVVPDDDSLFPALTAALAHIDALEARVAELRERDQVISHQLEQRAGGRDAFTQALLADLDAEKDKTKALAAERDALEVERDAADGTLAVALREVLAWAQWRTGDGVAQCGYCGNRPSDGHMAGCWVADALAPTKEEA